ncbi:His/Gly/Thr/Pro-type tRNA ligase C-terminal domain-containing protein, partial [Deinococcus frigens]
GGGGRYDGLAQVLGGPEVPGIGWAFGVERLLLALEAEGVKLPQGEGPLLYVVALDEEYVPHAAKIVVDARAVARAEFAYRAMKPGSAFKDAERRGVRWIALLGSQEVENGTLSLKNLRGGEQRVIRVSELAAFLEGAN